MKVALVSIEVDGPGIDEIDGGLARRGASLTHPTGDRDRTHAEPRWGLARWRAYLARPATLAGVKDATC